LAATAAFVDIPSVSHHEAALADVIETRLRACAHLEVQRIGDNVVGRTQLGRERRVILAGHLDTVPVNGNATARIEGDTLWGLGSADMKSGLAVMVDLAETVPAPAIDVTFVFYVCEEVDQTFSGLRQLLAERPDLLAGDAAILGEPTGGVVEAGCQGTMRVLATLHGERAHTARPWMGRNAIHRLGELLARVAATEERRPVLDGCEYREATQAVWVEGGVANNVVPDRAKVKVNHRFAPDRTSDQALAHLRSVLGDVDELEVEDVAGGAPPGLRHPLLADLVARTGQPPRAKLGWTDVAFFAGHGIPATNYGPGDPTLAHTATERVEGTDIARVHAVLRALITAS
jgi:succinyl-diaminopimelate desuccinylase